MERLGATDADRTDDVRPGARPDLDRQGIAGQLVGIALEPEVDAGMRGVEVLGDLLLDLDLLRRIAGAEAAVPADLDVARLGGRARARDGGECRRGLGRCLTTV